MSNLKNQTQKIENSIITVDNLSIASRGRSKRTGSIQPKNKKNNLKVLI